MICITEPPSSLTRKGSRPLTHHPQFLLDCSLHGRQLDSLSRPRLNTAHLTGRSPPLNLSLQAQVRSPSLQPGPAATLRPQLPHDAQHRYILNLLILSSKVKGTYSDGMSTRVSLQSRQPQRHPLATLRHLSQQAVRAETTMRWQAQDVPYVVQTAPFLAAHARDTILSSSRGYLSS